MICKTGLSCVSIKIHQFDKFTFIWFILSFQMYSHEKVSFVIFCTAYAIHWFQWTISGFAEISTRSTEKVRQFLVDKHIFELPVLNN